VRLTGRPDLKVRTRSGYYAADAKKEGTSARAGAPSVPTTTVPAALRVAEARALLSAPIDAGGIPVTLRADFADVPPAGSQVLVRARVDLSGLRWQEAEGRRQADLELVGGVFDAAGQPVGAPFGRRAELSVAASDLEKTRAAGFPYQQWVPLPPGRYEVRLVARERLLAQQGGASQPVDVPDLRDKKLAMSGLFLSASAPGGAGIADATAHRFRRGDSVYFQLYVYNPALDAGGKADVVLQAQLWSGGKAIAASPAQPARLEVKDGRPVPETNMVSLEGLSSGPYELRVVVADRKAGANVMRRVPITID